MLTLDDGYLNNLTYVVPLLSTMSPSLEMSGRPIKSSGVTKAAVLVNFLFGSGIMVANMLARASFPTVLQSPINCGAFAMLAGLIIVPVVSLITPKLSDEKKQAVFSCYEK